MFFLIFRLNSLVLIGLWRNEESSGNLSKIWVNSLFIITKIKLTQDIINILKATIINSQIVS